MTSNSKPSTHNKAYRLNLKSRPMSKIFNPENPLEDVNEQLNRGGLGPIEIIERSAAVPHTGREGSRSIDCLYHTQTPFSDGKHAISYLINLAVALDLDIGLSDHIDLTGISTEEDSDARRHHSRLQGGEEIGHVSECIELRRDTIKEVINDIDHSELPSNELYNIVKVSNGLEADWDSQNSEELIEKGNNIEKDYGGIAVHYDREGNCIKNPEIPYCSSVEEKVEEYIEENMNAIDALTEIEDMNIILHPSRAERGPLKEGIEKEHYHRLLDKAEEEDVVYELNMKVYLRGYLENGELPTEFDAILDYDGDLPDISIGTDTHRVGHSETVEEEYEILKNMRFPELGEYNLTESQMRLALGEDLVNIIDDKRDDGFSPYNVLEDAESEKVSISSSYYR